MAFAVGRSMATGDGGWKIRPMASAPSSAALWASVGLVMPQNLTWVFMVVRFCCGDDGPLASG